MSTTTGTSYTARSMNGIITIDDGQGTTISDGQITTNSMSLDSLYCDNIQTKNNTDNAYLYTTTSGIVYIGQNATTSTDTINCNTINAITPSTNVQVYQNSTGSISIGDLSTGNIKIGTAKPSGNTTIGGLSIINKSLFSALGNDIINFFLNLTTGSINIGNNLSSTGAINIGGSLSTTVFNGLVSLKSLISANVSDTISLFNNITTGTINL